jgi:hypothetical protein
MRFAPALLVAGLMVSSAAGCGLLNLLPGRTIHQKCGWKAEDYFADPKVIALCKAIGEIGDGSRLFSERRRLR